MYECTLLRVLGEKDSFVIYFFFVSVVTSSHFAYVAPRKNIEYTAAGRQYLKCVCMQSVGNNMKCVSDVHILIYTHSSDQVF